MIHSILRWSMLFLSALFVVDVSGAQNAPVEGIRKNTPRVHAFVNARIVQAPGRTIANATLVVRDGVISAVGKAPPPSDARIWDMKGRTIYPGLIDSYSEYGLPKSQQLSTEGQDRPQRQAEQRGAKNWNVNVQAHVRAIDLFVPDENTAEKLRTQGFTSVLTVPTKGIFKGVSALVNLGDGKANEQTVKEEVAQHITLTPERTDGDYPGSLMGIIAFIRQTLLDAEWYGRAKAAFAANPTLAMPETNETLYALHDATERKLPFVIDASDELNVLRANTIAEEFGLNTIVRGSGGEYRRLDAVKGTHRSIILPVNFPEAPAVQTPEEALRVSLRELRHWDEAAENPKRLGDAGVQFAMTSAMLKDTGGFLVQARKAVERGLSSDAALAALTTTPARMFGVDRLLGSLETGKRANFIITDGELFAEKTKIRESWIDGKRYEVKTSPEVDPRGTWNLSLSGQSSTDSLILNLKGEIESLSGWIRRKNNVKLSSASFSNYQLAVSFTGDSIGMGGIVRMTANVSNHTLTGTGEWSDGTSFVWSAARVAAFTAEPDTAKPQRFEPALFPMNSPFGEFGREKTPVQQTVLLRNATLWTCGPQGKIENADVIVEKGKILAIGKNLRPPSNASIIDGTGKHVTPGLIDAHSHTAASGNVNEAGQAVSAEVRIGDVIESDDISIYRELAGGLTALHSLHGSANPIGGQSQLIKLRWGLLPEQMKFDGAPPTLKFALGENVKQSNWGERFTTRYPQTRMGVEQIIRDEFQAALDYEKGWQKYEKEKTGIPPRRDLELEAILEILRGKRLIHCHSYVQSEILMLMRVAEDFGIRVQTFQHILEGYKVADLMAKHGAGASSFSDWWAYKMEVYDAIPHNGALMHDQGVLVSFNSDSDELARRLNTEAAKAVKYGGVPEEEALKFVTLNPAKQLRVDHRVGSLEVGKDADFAVWNGHPLSAFTKCEQTWIDGRKYFDVEEDRRMNEEVQRQRAVLVQKALSVKKSSGAEEKKKPEKRGDQFDHPHHNEIEGGN